MNKTRITSPFAIGKSGTGIGKSGTGIGKSGTGSRFADRLLASIAALTLVVPLSLAAETPPPFLMDVHDGVVTLTLHDQGRVISGQASLSSTSGSLVRVPMFSLELPGSKKLERGAKGRAGCDGIMYHGSGSGGQSVGDTGTVMYHGSGSGGQSVGGCGDLMYHGSGSGGQSVGDTGTVMYHGSGSGGQSVGGCKPGLAVWGHAEVLADASGLSVVVYRLGSSGPHEFLIAAADHTRDGKVENIWTAEP